jgi:predicted Zn finger-like uncharacterized protein
MIVQCDQCSAKFRLDDSKVKEGGAKVRCSKCKHIFLVQREALAEEADFDSLLNGLAPPASQLAGESDKEGIHGADQHPADSDPPSGADVTGSVEQPAGAKIPERESFDFDEFTFSTEPVSTPPAAPSGTEEKGEFAFGEMDIEESDSAGGEMPVPERGEPAFDETSLSFAAETSSSVPEIDVKVEGLEEPVVAGAPVDFGTTPPLSQEEDFSAVPAMEFSFEPEAAVSKDIPSAPESEKEAEQPASFGFGKFDFGEADSSVQTEREEATGGPDVWEWEKPGSEPLEQGAAHPHFEMPLGADEPSPLSLSSRRRGGSTLPIAAIAVAVLLVLALAGGGFYFFKEGPAAFNKVGLGFIAKWFGLETREEGGIAVRNTAAAFMNNNEAGEIFVITGETVNNFAKSRASIQVRATLYGPKGEVLLQKTAYCGNSLSKDQLTTLPLAELESKMGNQFGDSLSNLAVQAGKGIPFTVVLANVPKGAADFGVEVLGSTVASQ